MTLNGHETYEPIIGLEVHCQLQTEAKLFSPEPATSGAAPNTHVDPVSLGHPGTLPVLNERALELALRLGLATDCQIARRSAFARKHYFYPDLPKGYQITQHDDPLCYDGRLEIALGEDRAGTNGSAEAVRTRTVGLRRVHLEEDAGKSIHDRERGASLLDFNRCGVPLVEVVTEPDLRAPYEARLFLKELRQLARYLRVCDGHMETGALRCDANISLRRRGGPPHGAKVELKNLNSFRHVERALAYEVARQERVLESGGPVAPETRRWDARAQETRVLRTKETAPDYRYFPEPDLPPLTIGEDRLAKVRAALPEMPEARRRRLAEEMDLPPYDAAVLTQDRVLADYFEAVVDALYKFTGGGNTKRQAKAASNFVMGEVLRALNERSLAGAGALPASPKQTAKLIYLRLEEDLDADAAHKVFGAVLDGASGDPEKIARDQGLLQVDDREDLAPVVDRILGRHSKNVHRYRSGKKSLIGFFIGEVRAEFDDAAPDPKLVREMLKDRLD